MTSQRRTLFTSLAFLVALVLLFSTAPVSASDIFVAAINSTISGSPTYFFRVNTNANFSTSYIATYDVDQYGYLMASSNYDENEGVVYAATLRNLILKIDVKTGKVLNGQSPLRISPELGVLSLEYDKTSKQLYGVLSRFFPYVALFTRFDLNDGSYYTVKNITDEEGYRVLPYISSYCQKGHRYFYALQKTVSWGPITFKQGAISVSSTDLVTPAIPNVIAGLAMDTKRGALFALHTNSNESRIAANKNGGINSVASVDVVDTETGAVIKQAAELESQYRFDGRFTELDSEAGIIYASGYSINHRDRHFMFAININDGSVVYRDMNAFAPQLVAILSK